MPFSKKNDAEDSQPSTNPRRIFIGREAELLFFVQNILEPEEPTYNIISISGQGGVGKSTLLARFIEETHTAEFKDYCLTVEVDERQTTPANMMERFADQLRAAGQPLKKFEETLTKYKESLRRLQRESKEEQEALVRETVDIAGTVVEDIPLVDEVTHRGADTINELLMDAQRQQRLKDTVRLEDSIWDLTRAFVEDLNQIAEKQVRIGSHGIKRHCRVILFFDSFEVLANEATPWLLDYFLETEISLNVVLVVSGRDPIEQSTPDDFKRWLPYLDDNSIYSIALDSFTEEETHVFLAERGITDLERITTIWQLSRGLPLYLALLTANPQGEVDPTADVVANFLRWIPEQEQVKRRLVLDAALLSRPFNQDDLAAFTYLPEQERPITYLWLIQQPFVRSNPRDGRHSYHQLAQELFSRYLYQHSRREYYTTRRALTNHYQRCIEQTQAEGREEAYRSAEWLELVLALMRQLFLLPDEASQIKAIQQVLDACEHAKQTEEIIRVLHEISQEQSSNQAYAGAREVARQLLQYIEADQASNEFLAATNYLLEKVSVEPSFAPELLTFLYHKRGIAYRLTENFQDAIQDFDRAISLGPTNADAYYNRGLAYVDLREYQQAIEDFNRVLDLAPTSVWAYAARGRAYYHLQRYEEALFSFTKALELCVDEPIPEYVLDTIRHAPQTIESEVKAEFIATLAPHLPEQLLAEAVIAVQGIDKMEIRVQALRNLAEYLPAKLQAEVLREVERIAHELEKELPQESLITYSIMLAVSADSIPIGGKLEVTIYLSPTSSKVGNGYILEIAKDVAARSELNMLLNAPGFQVDGNSNASLPFDFHADEEVVSELVASQAYRFNLTALRSGTAKITVELYQGSTFEIVLTAEVHVTKVDAAVFPKPHVTTQPRPILLPDLMLQVRTDWNEAGSACFFRFSFSSLRSSLLPADIIDYHSDMLPSRWVGQIHGLLREILEDGSGALLEDAYSRVVSFGQYLFQRVFPPELQREIRNLAQLGRVFTLLILTDQDAWIPWELLHDGQAFLGEHFIVGRWPQELDETCPYEFPIGTVHIAHYADVQSLSAEMWATLFESAGTPHPNILPGGMFDSLGSIEGMHGLYLMRLGRSPGQTDLRDAPVQYHETSRSNPIEQELQPAKLNLRRNRPLVTLGYMNAGQAELTTLEETWAPTFIHAGCSAFIGSLWAVQRTVEAAFVASFYRRLWAGDSLGEAFKAGRKLAQLAVPESFDWLAYMLFGDPMARPYRPMKGQGYAVIEPIGREMDDPLSAGSAARFRVSLRRIPPIWHEERVIEVAEDLTFENLEVNIIASGLQVTPPSPIVMSRTPSGDYLGWFTLVVPPKTEPKTYVVQVYFVDEIQPIHRLRFSLKVGKRGGDQR